METKQTISRVGAKPLLHTLVLALGLGAAGPALPQAAADLNAGRAKVEANCAACHGANGVSVADNIPNLAGQRGPYLENQLRALKSGARRNAVMGAVAAQLSAQDISDVAAYFASLPGASGTAKTALPAAIAMSQVTIPPDHRASMVMYQTVNRPDINQVRYLYANEVALRAAREGRDLPNGSHLVLEQHAARLGPDGKPVMGSDGYFVADRLIAYAVMERQAGWGKDIPANLRNEDWQYGVYTPARQLRSGVNHSECLACHKPLDRESYTFSIKALTEVAKRR
ncbi:MAG: cytochrome P460 family protein [Burkholderiales bacterium]|nr:cytochrome P460 family protein [Burkholderiales bacterium]